MYVFLSHFGGGGCFACVTLLFKLQYFLHGSVCNFLFCSFYTKIHLKDKMEWYTVF